jgi:uncharacterized membrane protein YoaK (UPF0700 family)
MPADTVDQDRRSMPSLMLLTFVTGLIDAASVLGLGRVFTGNMTGNVVFLGFALGGAHEVSIGASVVALAGFLTGAACGGRVMRRADGRALQTALGLEFLLLLGAFGVAAFNDGRTPVARGALLVLLAMPMGLQTATVRCLAVADMTTTVLTLTLTGVAADSTLAGGTNPRLVRRLGAVALMLFGALAGALLLRRGLAWPIGAAVATHAMALAGFPSSRAVREAA